ncbi:hypothetical protein [Haloactinomyces albus]|uniref:Uncharacterized protein n=1 Tax=Haloactinomyces albus TaxID=1352928 RepID=A0AAE3Z7V4_9ACTN|nr:hypothetical protein [Haloactinomyces albus]MDR7299946.1 hypothetical protein [Haloactinomyces albus]
MLELFLGVGLIELGATVLLLLALLITCTALWDIHPPKGPQR